MQRNDQHGVVERVQTYERYGIGIPDPYLGEIIDYHCLSDVKGDLR